MFRKENPHPDNKRVGDCVKRACVFASEINYHDIAIMLNRYRKITGAKKFNSDYNWRDFIVNVLLGCDMGKMQYINNGKRFQVSEYAHYCKSKAIMQVAGHLVACNGKGDYLDTWDCGYKSIYKVWHLPSYEAIVAHIRANHKALCKGLTLEQYKHKFVL